LFLLKILHSKIANSFNNIGILKYALLNLPFRSYIKYQLPIEIFLRDFMNKLARYILIAVTILIAGFVTWYFSGIVISILIAAVLSIIGQPIMKMLLRLKIGRFNMPSSIASLITLLALLTVIALVICFLAPIVGNVISEISSINFDMLTERLKEPLERYNAILHNTFPTMNKEITIQSMITSNVKQLINFTMFTNAFNSIASFVVNLLVDGFTVIFVCYFFLQDKNIFPNMIMVFVPIKYEENAKRALNSINVLLVRYFTGISIETIIITILNTIVLTLIGGVNFQLAVVLGFFAGVINVIPYIGPIIGNVIGSFLGAIAIYHSGMDINLGLTFIILVLCFFGVHLVDVAILQPYIYSNSVKAHPLEIFLVILIAGHIGGIIGMLIAIPTYTVIRVFAKEFLSNFKIVQKLTDKI